MNATGIEALVCNDISIRQEIGIRKYGKTVEESGDDMLQHAYEEAIDLAIYLKAEIEKRKAKDIWPKRIVDNVTGEVFFAHKLLP